MNATIDNFVGAIYKGFYFNFAVNHLSAVMQAEHFVKLDVNIIRVFVIKAGKADAFRM